MVKEEYLNIIREAFPSREDTELEGAAGGRDGGLIHQTVAAIHGPVVRAMIVGGT